MKTFYNPLSVAAIAILTAALFAGSCKKQMYGGYVYADMYILEDGNLIDAQNYVKEIPYKGGTFDIEFVTYGLGRIFSKRGAAGIVMTSEDIDAASDEDLYDIVDISPSTKVKRYRQTVTIAAEPNDGKERVAVYTVTANFQNGRAADITVRQPGTK